MPPKRERKSLVPLQSEPSAKRKRNSSVPPQLRPSTKRKTELHISLQSFDKPRKQKGKSRRLPLRSHHPSQSSIDVPNTVKIQVKNLQDNRCWLCNQRAHKKNRPLQIAHILPQAISERNLFISYHKSGCIRLGNIHDTANLIALCSICHFAFDLEEWTFLPKDITTWLRDIKAKPEGNLIREWNSLRDLEFQRWRLDYDLDSEASRDNHFKSAFINEPIKMSRCEVGAVIIRNSFIAKFIPMLATRTTEVDRDLYKVCTDYEQLKIIWLHSKSPCSKQECSICSSKINDGESDKNINKTNKGGRANERDEGDKVGEDKDKEDGDRGEDDEDEDNEDEDNEDEDDKDEDNEDEDDEDEDDEDEDNEDEDDEDEDDDDTDYDDNGEGGEDEDDNNDKWDKGNRHYQKSRRVSRREQLDDTQNPSKTPSKSHQNQSSARYIARKRNRSTNHKKSALYDESVPYSHREGYTWAETTSSELMAIFQGSPYRKLPNGGIIITGPPTRKRPKWDKSD